MFALSATILVGVTPIFLLPLNRFDGLQGGSSSTNESNTRQLYLRATTQQFKATVSFILCGKIGYSQVKQFVVAILPQIISLLLIGHDNRSSASQFILSPRPAFAIIAFHELYLFASTETRLAGVGF